MNFIDNIEIKNFKSIRHQKIEGCKRINVFVGHPNTGKSNIIEALSLFSINEDNLNFCDFVRIEKLTTLFYDGDINHQAEVKINDDYRFVAKFEIDKIYFQEQFERQGTSFEKKDSGIYYDDDSNRVEEGKDFRVVEKKDDVISYKRSYISTKEVQKIRKYEFKKGVSTSTKGHFSLEYPFGNNIFNIISANSGLKKQVEEFFSPYGLELLFDNRNQNFTILKRTSAGIFSIPYELIADTLQRVIFYKAATVSNENTVILFEEPEAHMFPLYVSKFTSDIAKSNTNQFFISTHSPYVIDYFLQECRDDLAIHELYYEDGETKCHTLSSSEIDIIYRNGVDWIFDNLKLFRNQTNKS